MSGVNRAIISRSPRQKWGRGLGLGSLVLTVLTASSLGVGASASASTRSHRAPTSASTSWTAAPAALRHAIEATLGSGAPARPRLVGASLQSGTLLDPTPGNSFGIAVSVSGPWAIVGASNAYAGGVGEVYFYHLSGTSWTLSDSVADPDAAVGGLFGVSVSLSGFNAVVGAPGEASSAGSAFFYSYTSTGWQLVKSVADPGATANDDFGDSVALSGTHAVIGALGTAFEGEVYFYVGDAGGWGLSKSFPDPTAQVGDNFGQAVAISGSNAVVGAPGVSDFQGATYLFSYGGVGIDSWWKSGTIDDPGAKAHDYFGEVVAMQGTTALSAAPFTNANAGAVYVIDEDSSAWAVAQTIDNPAAASSSYFGDTLAISATNALIGTGYDAGGAPYLYSDVQALWTQEAELSTPIRNGTGIQSYAVALSGDEAFVSSVGEPSAADTVNTYDLASGQWQWLTSTTGVSQSGFGGEVAVSGTQAIVSEPGSNGEGSIAFFGLQSNGSWSQDQSFSDQGSSPQSGDGFDRVALSGSWAVVGSPGALSSEGRAFLFHFSAGSWSLYSTLADPAATAGDQFGIAVAISGTNALIGANLSANVGKAYVYRDGGPNWVLMSTLSDPSATTGEEFASSVAIDGTQAVVGAPGAAGGGEAFFFAQSSGTWTPEATAVDPQGTAGAFGFAVAIDATQAVVGAPLDGSSEEGSATFYEFTGGAWQVQHSVTDPSNSVGDEFGYAVSLSSSNAAIGAPNAAKGEGQVYVFNHEAQWTDVATLSQETPVEGDLFGSAVGLDEDTLVAGAPASGTLTPEVDFFSQLTAQAIYAHAPVSTNAGQLVSVASASSAALSVSYAIDSSSTASGCQVNSVGDVTTPINSTGGTCVVVLYQYGNATVAAAQNVLVPVSVAAVVPQKLVFENAQRGGNDLRKVVLAVKGGYPLKDLVKFHLHFSVVGRGCSLNGDVLRVTRATTCVVKASQLSTNFPAVHSTTMSFTFALATQKALTLVASTTKSSFSVAVRLSVRGGSGPGAVSYHASGAGCTASGATLHASRPSTCRVVATKAASALYAAASSKTVVVVFTR